MSVERMKQAGRVARVEDPHVQELLDKKKADTITPDEVIELETIGELDNIFSYINAVIAAQANVDS